MKKLSVLFFCLFFLNACSEEKSSYVKDIYIKKENDSYTVNIFAFDFETGEGTVENTYTSDSLDKLMVLYNNDNNYNFRLCENVFFNLECAEEFNQTAQFLVSNKVPVTANLIISEEYIDDLVLENRYKTPIYNLSNSENVFSGFVVKINEDDKSSVLFSDGKQVDILDERHWNVLKIIAGETREINYPFYNDKYYARIKLISNNYSIENDTLNIDLCVMLKSYRGISNSLTDKKRFVELLRDSMKSDILQLYDNVYVNSVYNLYWYKDLRKKTINSINVKIDII